MSGRRAPYKAGDKVKAVYLSREQGTCLAIERTVTEVHPHPDGVRWHVMVDLPVDHAGYLVAASGHSDYLEMDTPANCARCSLGICERH